MWGWCTWVCTGFPSPGLWLSPVPATSTFCLLNLCTSGASALRTIAEEVSLCLVEIWGLEISGWAAGEGQDSSTLGKATAISAWAELLSLDKNSQLRSLNHLGTTQASLLTRAVCVPPAAVFNNTPLKKEYNPETAAWETEGNYFSLRVQSWPFKILSSRINNFFWGKKKNNSV